jgi:hypothetical protein
MAPLSKMLRYSFAYTALHWFNSIIGFVFAIFVTINHFHLKIDIYKLFISTFN